MLSAHMLTHSGWEEMFMHIGKTVHVHTFCLFQSTFSLADNCISFESVMQNSQHSWHWMKQFHEKPRVMAKLSGRLMKTLRNYKRPSHLYPDYKLLLCYLSQKDKNTYSKRFFTLNLTVRILIQQCSNSMGILAGFHLGQIKKWKYDQILPC